MNLNKFFTIAALSSSALCASGSVFANDVFDTPSFVGMTSTFNAYHGAGAFTDTFIFDTPAINSSTASVITIGAGIANIDFSSGTLNGQALSLAKDATGFIEVLYTPFSYAVTGPLTLSVSGMSASNASYSGTLNVMPAVPEPATVALMIAGLGAVGFVGRRRNAKV